MPYVLQQLDDIIDRLDGLDTRLQSVEMAVSDLQTTNTAGLDDVEAAITGLDASNDGGFESVRLAVETLDASNTTGLENTISAIDVLRASNITELNDILTAITNADTNNVTGLTEIKDETWENTRKVEDVEQVVRSFRSNIQYQLGYIFRLLYDGHLPQWDSGSIALASPLGPYYFAPQGEETLVAEVMECVCGSKSAIDALRDDVQEQTEKIEEQTGEVKRQTAIIEEGQSISIINEIDMGELEGDQIAPIRDDEPLDYLDPTYPPPVKEADRDIKCERANWIAGEIAESMVMVYDIYVEVGSIDMSRLADLPLFQGRTGPVRLRKIGGLAKFGLAFGSVALKALTLLAGPFSRFVRSHAVNQIEDLKPYMAQGLYIPPTPSLMYKCSHLMVEYSGASFAVHNLAKAFLTQAICNLVYTGWENQDVDLYPMSGILKNCDSWPAYNGECGDE